MNRKIKEPNSYFNVKHLLKIRFILNEYFCTSEIFSNYPMTSHKTILNKRYTFKCWKVIQLNENILVLKVNLEKKYLVLVLVR